MCGAVLAMLPRPFNLSLCRCAKRRRLPDGAEPREGGLEPREGGLEPRRQERRETQWLPCLPGIYGVRVCASSDFDHAGCDYIAALGVSIPPTMNMIRDWIDYITPSEWGATGCEMCDATDPHDQHHHTGAFWITRSVCVEWDDGTQCLYCAGDLGTYDIVMDYSGLASSQAATSANDVFDN